ncbi:SspB-related isopeptide-forming adhesin [Streptococcus sp. Marseille-P7376]|uniref:SspB-related isopeptide-forming adhesin n=1 Tax=Streptococcus sp. Marseille-P7376 TaxID=2592044 RepID=UPI0011E624F7|nr:SspB-related isopeptide-forming adhesin [Streptococcus sp. Marseille-P7376]
MKSNLDTKAYGSIRKTKRWGTCGVILGLAALMGTAQIAQADEVTDATPVAVANTASNLKDTQPAPTAENQAAIKQANQADGSVSLSNNTETLEGAVAKAQAEGVNVVKDATVDKGVTTNLEATQQAQSEIAAAQNEQQKQIEQTTSDYVDKKHAQKEAADTAISNNKVIRAENQALQGAYDQAKAAAEKTQEELKKSKEAVKKEFPDTKITETPKNITVDPNSKISYDQYKQTVLSVQKSNQQAILDHAAKVKKDAQDLAKRNSEAKDKVDAENKVIAAENQKIIDDQKRYEKELTEAEKNKAKDGYATEVIKKFLIFGRENTKNAKLVSVKGAEFISQKKYWEQVDAKGGNVFNVIGTNWDNLVTKDAKEATSATSGSILGRLAVGQTAVARYEGLSGSYDGKKIVAAEFQYTAKKANSQYGKINLNFEGNPTSTILAGTLAGKEGYELDVEVRYFGEDGKEILPVKGKPFLYSVASMNSYGEGTSHVEYARISSDDKFIPINGSKVARYGDLVYSKANLEDLDALGLDKPWDREDSPYAYKGAGIVSTDKRIRFSFGVETNGQESGIVSQWFAFNTDFKSTSVTPPSPNKVKPLKPFTPETPKPSELNLQTVALPPKPKTKPEEKVPKKPQPPTVHYNDYKLSAQPQIKKSVQNADGVDIDGKYVAKNSLNKWILNVEALPAGRPHTTNLVAGDPTPSGFKPEVDLIKKDNPNWNISFDQNNKLTIKATESLLRAVNGDLSKAYKIAPFVYWGRPQNDAADYVNGFELVVNGGKDKGGYARKSNIVKISTPGKKNPDPKNPNNPKDPNRTAIQPEKHNYNAEGKIVDGKAMAPEATNHYISKMTNLPYKGDQSAKEAIQRGFGFIEDYPDEAVNPLEGQFKVRDAEGKEVNGLKMYHVLSKDSLTGSLKKMVEDSGISPTGAFYMWTAERPEEFYQAYVKKGMDLYFHTPMKNKAGFTGEYKNQVHQIQFGNGYYSNIVKNHVSIPKPDKVNKDKAGTVINGKTLTPDTVNYYEVKLDYSKYKGIEPDKSFIKKGFFGVDDFPEEALDIDQSGIQMLDEDGKEVKGLSSKIYSSLAEAPEEVQKAFKAKNKSPKGAIQVFSADDPEAFFESYVKTGKVITLRVPMKIKKEFAKKGGEYQNTAYQIDFGQLYETPTIINQVPKPNPEPKPEPKTPEGRPQQPIVTTERSLPATGEHASAELLLAGLAMTGAAGLVYGKRKKKEA